MSAKAAELHQLNRIEPKLSNDVAMLDVDMGRLRSFQTVEEARWSASITWKTIRPRHGRGNGLRPQQGGGAFGTRGPMTVSPTCRQ
jgi:hypothetical protein